MRDPAAVDRRRSLLTRECAKSKTSYFQCLPAMGLGTLGQLSPALQFTMWAPDCGADAVEIDLEPSAVAQAAGAVILGPATDGVPRWVAAICG